jgi:hypothetical protein
VLDLAVLSLSTPEVALIAIGIPKGRYIEFHASPEAFRARSSDG